MSEPTYRDRTEGYVPEWGPHHRGPSREVLVGHGDHEVVYPLAMGLADELNRDPERWWWAQIDPGNHEDPEHWSHFVGHFVLIDVEMTTSNERRVHDWKGYDEIRKAGTWRLYFNRQCVYGGWINDPLETLLHIREVAKKLLGDSIPIRQWTAEEIAAVVGRKVYYADEPAVVKYWFPEQGCVVLRYDGDGIGFPLPAYERERESKGEQVYRDDPDEVKVDLLDKRIWWWRD